MQRNDEKCREMQRNDEKCREMLITKDKCREMQINAAECSATDGHYFGKNTGVRRAKLRAQFKFYL